MTGVLRQDLMLQPAEADEDGAPSWTLYDPAQNRFFRLGPLEVELLAVGEEDPIALAAAASARLGQNVTAEEAGEFITFLRSNNLLRADGGAARARLMEARQAARPHPLAWLVRNYLSVRVPLVRPDHFLTRTVQYVSWWFDPRLKWLLLALGLAGLAMVVQRWDEFFATAVDYFTPRGLAAYGATIVLIKILHELGHAYAVKWYGGKVPAMGVSLIVFWPVLYTDTTDAWRLSRRARLEVDAAGIKVEIAVALLALLLWLALPDSRLRGLMFLASTTSLLLTFFINLNPLMRFDGYYMLSDWAGVENLQERAAAQARWHIREWLFDLGAPPPEAPKRWLVIYAVASWVYRLTLTLSIAFFIYAMAFKLLGLILLGLQVWTYIIKPFFQEIRKLGPFWPQIRRSRRSAVSALLAASVIAVLALPIGTTVSFPARYQAATAVPIYAAVPGRVSRWPETQSFRAQKGDILTVLESPETDFEIRQVEANLVTLRWQMEMQGLAPPWLSQSLVISANLQSGMGRLASLKRQAELGSVTIPDDLQVVDLLPQVHDQQWIGEGELLARAISVGVWEIKGFIPESDAGRIQAGMHGYFVFSDGVRRSLAVTVTEIEPAAVEIFESPLLLSPFGGPLLAKQDKENGLIPDAPYYRVRLIVDQKTVPDPFPQELPGFVVLDAGAQSAAQRLLMKAMMFLRRELSF